MQQPQVWFRKNSASGANRAHSDERDGKNKYSYNTPESVFAPCNSYAIKVDCRNRNCYNCRRFRHLARNCRNRGTENRIRKGIRLEYRRNENNKRTKKEQNDLN